ncbi:hypothetical protein AXF42_Ash014203 [Apostasia shenzhenica]|uniref:Retrovirus-related Pol polyprotein from transposon TNT 1-94 n=1 Tax=Apostasia shenzhenica TaxID=1088818 RepID=A0A2I0A183_9ASPA|nr:hypothetical protein AXF42_Ash014203 [Apostasia shenzhenica]
MLIHDYELFELNPDESIKDIFTRFTNITNGLISLGKIFTNEELVRKILRCLPREYNAKATAIVEARDFSTLELDMLLGSLIIYELEMKRKKKKKDDEEGARKKKALALKASSPPTTESEGDSSKDDEEKLEDEIALVSRHFNSLIKKKKQLFCRSQRKPFKAKDTKENTSKIKENEVTCYNCNQPEYIKPNCPLLKGKKIRKKKTFVATWSDSNENSSSDEKEEIANFCLMTDIESDDEGSTNSVKNSSLSNDELEENLEENQ